MQNQYQNQQQPNYNYLPQGQPQYGMQPQGQPQQGMQFNPQNQAPYYVQNPQMQHPGQVPNQNQYFPQQGQQNQPYEVKQGGILGNLARLEGIFVKQKLELCEAMTSCETKNRYYIYPADQNGERIGGPAFIAKEDSGCCTRICCSDRCRPYSMHFQDYLQNEQTVFNGDRKYKCTFLCCNRPEIKVYLGTNQSDYIGKIVDKFQCCSIHLQIFDKDEQLLYRIEGSICQLGIMCKQFPCKACQVASFDIFNKEDQAVGLMEKKHNGCCKACFTDADNFTCRFPPGIPPEHKALLAQAVILLDYQYFEDNNEEKQ